MVSVIVPTYKEREVLPLLVEKITKVFQQASIEGEVIVVDDNSPDGTGRLAQEMTASYPLQVVRREKKGGLASAVLVGFKVARGEILGVMDADLSHDPERIPEFVRAIENGSDLVVGSRYVKGGGIENWPLFRRMVSKVAILFARPLTPVKDATSGFFFLKRKVIEGVSLDPLGFKIGLEIFVKGNHSSILELPFTFQDRVKGKSKMSFREVVNYLRHLGKLTAYRLRRRTGPTIRVTGG